MLVPDVVQTLFRQCYRYRGGFGVYLCGAVSSKSDECEVNRVPMIGGKAGADHGPMQRSQVDPIIRTAVRLK